MSEKGTVQKNTSEYRTGMLSLISCQLIWGFCPIYWEALKPIPSWIIILYRALTMFVYAYIAARIRYSREQVWAPLRDKDVRRKYFSAGLILLINWSIYIWAMTSERVIQASIGYYIEPIVICAVGILLFREQLTKYNVTAMLFAMAAIILILIHYRQIPGVALGLAASWACYSAIKKTAEQPPILSMTYETMIYALISLFAIIYIESHGMGAVSMNVPGKYALMFLSGIVTLVPIGLFNIAATRVPLYVIGLCQYMSPSISLILGIFMFREPIDVVQIIAFAIIWTGLCFFSYGEIRNAKEHKAS